MTKRRSRNNRKFVAERDDFSTSLERLSPPVNLLDLALLRNRLSLLEDRRAFHPERGYRRAGTFSRRDQSNIISKRVARDKPSSLLGAERFTFAVPDRVVLCARRKERREVLFAIGKGGKGSRKPKRRNYYSGVSCK